MHIATYMAICVAKLFIRYRVCVVAVVMFYIKLFQHTVLMDHFDRYDDNIAQHIIINLIVVVGPCLATGTSSEVKADS